jgi:hypothetical protein
MKTTTPNLVIVYWVPFKVVTLLSIVFSLYKWNVCQLTATEDFNVLPHAPYWSSF